MSRTEWTIGRWPGHPTVKLVASVKRGSKGKQHVGYVLVLPGDERIEIDAKDARILVQAKLADPQLAPAGAADDEDEDDDDEDDEDRAHHDDDASDALDGELRVADDKAKRLRRIE